MTVSKFRHPPCRRMLARPRLNEIVREQEDRRLVVLCAGAGYGKTILMAQLFDQQTQPAVWYRFDSRDTDPGFFINTLLRGIKRTNQSFNSKSVKRKGSPSGKNQDHEHIFVSLVSELVDSNAVPITFFFDDFQEVNDSDMVAGLVQFLVNYLDGDCRVIVSCRERPHLSLGRLRAQRVLLELGKAQLKFSFAETASLMNPSYAKNMDHRELALLYAWSEGWPAALTMFRRELRGGGKKSRTILSSRKLERVISGYFTKEVMGGLDDDMRRFLMLSSLADPVLSPICDIVLSKRMQTPASGMLGSAEDRTLMITSNDEGDAYRFHPLFRRFLHKELQGSLSSVEIMALHHEYAHAYARQDMFAAAIAHYIKGKDWDRAASIVESQGERMLASGKVVLVNRWLEEIPKKIVSGRPWLGFIAASVSARKGAMNKARRRLSAVRKAFERAGDREGQYRCAIAESDLLARAGRGRESLKAAESALNQAGNLDDTISAMCRVSAGFLFKGEGDKAESILKKATRAGGRVTVRAGLDISAAQLYQTCLSGDFKSFLADADKCAAEAKRIEDTAQYCRFIKEKAVALYLTGHYGKALKLARESLLCARRLGDRLWEWTSSGTIGRIGLYAGESERGVAEIGKAMERFEAHGLTAPESANHLGSYYRRCGDYLKALEMHQRAFLESKRMHNRYLMAISLANIGADRIRLSTMRSQDDNEELTEALRIARMQGYKYVETQASFHLAWRDLNRGNEDSVRERMQSLLKLAAQCAHNHFLTQEGKQSLELLVFAFGNGIQQAYLIAVFKLIGAGALRSLTPLLKSGNPDVRREAVAAVGAAAGRLAIPHIKHCLKDKDAGVSEAADRELSRIRSSVETPQELLSRRELEVLQLLAEGLSNLEIGQRLFINEQTVKTHVGNIFHKLGLTRRVQAATYFGKQA